MSQHKTMFRSGKILAALLMTVSAPLALAGPGFIAGSRVSVDETGANIEIRFNCKTAYLNHEPQQVGDSLRIFLNPTEICNGVSPVAAESRGRYRPSNADSARLNEFSYDGDSAAGSVLTLNFREPVRFFVEADAISFKLIVRVIAEAPAISEPAQDKAVLHRQVLRPQPEASNFVINLASIRRVPTVADLPEFDPTSGHRVFYSEFEFDGVTWYQLRLGNFSSANEAMPMLDELKQRYPGAWIDELDPGAAVIDLTTAADPSVATLSDDEIDSPAEDTSSSTAATEGRSKADELMEEARQIMIAGDRDRAIQFYTKILQLRDSSRHAEAQEYLALAREKNGQLAHAKAEYNRYLSLYPNTEGAARVSQRLAAINAADRQANTSGATGARVNLGRRNANNWRVNTFFSQYYRRDVNQQNDQNAIVSQSALYSDVNVDARRRGERFDFSSRLSAGYRSDFLGEGFSGGNQSRVTYAYADLADARTGLRGRLGRQSRNTGGILGRFDGFNLGYQATEKILVNAVIGKPAYSANDGIDSSRTFVGTSLNYGPMFDGLDLGVFFIHQEIEGITDRQAIGGEFRYFGDNQNVWGQIDYDTSYNELGSAFLQASWRFANRLTVHGSIDRRHGPYLSAGNAMIGQPVQDFSELARIFSEDEIRQLGLDRSPLVTSYLLGLSYTLGPKWQISADANRTAADGSPASGGVLGTPASNYRYFSANFLASSLFTEGDATIVGLRQSESDTSKVLSMTLDSRFPLGRSWRINARLRVDRRDRVTDTDYEWIYTPGIRIQYRRNQKFRIELEAGKQFAQREAIDVSIDRESYFFSIGYRAFF